MEAQDSNPPPSTNDTQNVIHSTQKAKRARRRQLQYSADTVFAKGSSYQTLPPLSKQLKDVTDCIVGLQFAWEYRSPTKSVPPHYQCKLCDVSRLQHDMLAHVTGWKHTLKYLKHAHSDKIPFDETEAAKDPALRKKIKEVAAEVEKAEGRGQLKVILKEPRDVPAFKDLRSAIPKAPPPGPLMGPKMPLFGPRFPDPIFPGERFPRGGHNSDHTMGMFEDSDFRSYSDKPVFNEPDFNRRPFQDHYHSGGGDGFGMGHLEERPGRLFPEEGLDNQMGRLLMDRPLGQPMELRQGPDRNSLPNTLLAYLDTFQIENESDAQIVLKVTQKLTDVLMEYRVRTSSSGSDMNSLPMRPSGFPSRMSGGLSGPTRHIDGPPRRQPDFYN